MATLAIESGASVERMRDLIADAALRGLALTYLDGPGGLPHTLRYDGRRAIPQGTNVRYALIALIGLAEAQNTLADEVPALIDELCARIASAIRRGHRLTPGDCGLGLWAVTSLEDRGSRLRGVFSPERAVAEFHRHSEWLDSVELSWLLLGATHAASRNLSPAITEPLADAVRRSLLRLYNPDTRLCYRHDRRGWTSRVSRRVACFANQIYPLMALAVHVRWRPDPADLQIVSEFARNMLALQGPRGQWWWLYDAASGMVVEQYPVFSVHQDGMAPMALGAVSAATGLSMAEPIAASLQWVFGANERGESMLCDNAGLILRDIHKSKVGRLHRIAKATVWCAGGRLGQTMTAKLPKWTVNRECRPYHLGWALYAAAFQRESESGA